MPKTTATATPAEQALDELLGGRDEDTGGDNPDDGIVEEEQDGDEPGEQPEGDEDPDEDGEQPDGEGDGEPAGDGEADEDDEGDEGPEGDGDVVSLAEGQKVRLPDGTEVSITGDDALRHKDYTQKTQELAEQRRAFEEQQETFEQQQTEVTRLFEQMRDWHNDRAEKPDEWLREIAREYLPDVKARTQAVARAIKGMADEGLLDPDFVETFGIDSGQVAELATSAAEQERLDRIEQRLEQQDTQAAEQQRVAEAARELQGQWEQIKATHGLSFESRQDEFAAKREVLELARSAKTSDLTLAYDALRARTAPDPDAGKGGDEPPERDPDVTQKKRSGRAISQKSGGSGGGGEPPRKGKSTREAAQIALEKFAATDA